MTVIFDLDGVICDTREAVRRSYLEVGVRMPEEGFILSWKEWLPDMVGGLTKAILVHNAKNDIYPQLLPKYGTELPPASLARELLIAGTKVGICTSASKPAALLVLEHIGLLGRVKLLGTGLTKSQKKQNIRGELRSCDNPKALKREGVVYVDDSPGIIDELNRAKHPRIKAFHYDQNNYPKLEKEVRDAWTQLSWQPDATKDLKVS